MQFKLNKKPFPHKPYRVLSWASIKNLRATPIECKEDTYEVYRKIGERLVVTCLIEGGVGLAASQVGIFKRMFLIREFQEDNESLLPSFKLYINPHFAGIPEEGKTSKEEYCLSVPGKGILIERFNKIKADWVEFDENGNAVVSEKTLEGHLARVFAHEFDHLNGVSIPQRWEIQNKKSTRKKTPRKFK